MFVVCWGGVLGGVGLGLVGGLGKTGEVLDQG